jgi:DNA-binding HxlR family transcriptional regulator
LPSSLLLRRMRCRSCTPIPEEVRRAADLLERRWTVSIIWASHEGAVRFNEFSQSLGSIPPATLATRLVELEQAGILARATVEGRPPRTEYRLTARGLELRGLVAALRQLAEA